MNDYRDVKIDYTVINEHIRRARLEQSVAVGEAIANGCLAIWAALKHAGRYVNQQAYTLTKTPDSYSTSLRRP